MRQSKTELYLHAVWATLIRQPFLSPRVESEVHACIAADAEKLGCIVLAIDGMPDHVHLVVRFPARIAVAEILKQIKGTSSRFAGAHFECEEPFAWQAGCGAFTLSRSHVRRAISYVQNQKRRHKAAKTWDEWEKTDTESEPSDE